VVERIVDRESI